MSQEQTKVLWKFRWYTRGGDVESYFVATREEVESKIGRALSFGEILGKHSWVEGTLDKEDLVEISEDQEFIEKFVELIGYTGYNPLYAMNCGDCGLDEDECECEE